MLVGRGLFYFVAIVRQDVTEARPALLRHGDGRAKVGLHLRYPHVDAAVVLADVEVEILVVDVHVPALGQVRLVRVLVGAELVQQVGECVPKLDHALRRYSHLKIK